MTVFPETRNHKKIEERFWEKVDKSGECWVWMAAKNDRGYGFFKVHPRMMKAHRVAYELECGPIPAGQILDHVCHNTSCVRPSHLRLATNKQNQENRKGANADNTSGFLGVIWDPVRRKWLGSVAHNGRRHYVGHFGTVEEANTAVVKKRQELYTHNDRDRSTQVA